MLGVGVGLLDVEDSPARLSRHFPGSHFSGRQLQLAPGTITRAGRTASSQLSYELKRVIVKASFDDGLPGPLDGDHLTR